MFVILPFSQAAHSQHGNGIAGPAQPFPAYSEYLSRFHGDVAHSAADAFKRQQFYETTVARAEKQNSKPDRLWTAAVNGHWDKSPAELQALMGFVHTPSRQVLSASLGEGIRQEGMRGGLDVADLPMEHNWTQLMTTKPERIRNQNCGNCWAQATSAMLEAHIEIHMGDDKHVKTEEVTHCSSNPYKCGGSGGCEGSTPELALAHVLDNGLVGLELPEDALGAGATGAWKCPTNVMETVKMNEAAPHEALSGVRFAAADSPAKMFGLIGWERLPENRHEPLMRALVQRGPVAVAVSTDWEDSLTTYGSGIYNGCSKDTIITHSVLAVGYGQSASTEGKVVKYWRLQNSWGAGFGEDGHFRLLRTDSSTEYCGTNKDPTVGVGCEGGPQSVTVCGMCGILYDSVVPHFEAKTALSKNMLAMREARTNSLVKVSRHEITRKSPIRREPAGHRFSRLQGLP